MEAEFAEEGLVPRARIVELCRRSNGPGLRRLFAQMALLLATLAVLLVASEPALVFLALVAHGIVQVGFFGLLHESSHKTALADPTLNHAAAWIAALVQPMSPALMRAFHFEHHRNTHDLDRDPELAGIRAMAAWPRGVGWWLTASGLPLLIARFGWALFAALVPRSGLWERVLPFVPARSRRRVAWEARVLLLFHGTVVGAAAVALPELARFYVAMLLAHALLSLYLPCEHRGLPEEGSILRRTRSIVTPAWFRWLLWNMPYHAEHHAWPAVPWYALEALHQEVAPHLVHRASPWQLYRSGGR